MVANFTQSFPYKSGKNNPCPICSRTKDADCKWNDEVILCHSYPDGQGSLAGYNYKSASQDGGWGIYYLAKELEKKQVRAQSRQEYFYPDRNGNRLIRVTRTDDGLGHKKFYQSHWDGQKWVNGLTDEVKKTVPIYKYQQVRQAIANGQPIFMVEGEGVADTLWNLGIAATTTLGGSKKYRTYGNYSQDLAGASLILSPDRDECGIAHMEDIANHFPTAQWCYPFPNSPLWKNIPKNAGVDLADWINNDKATVADIMGAIEPKREIQQQQPEKAVDPDTQLKLEIQLFSKEPDPIRKLRLKSEICSNYRIRAKDLEDLVRHIERAQSTKEVKAYTFTELLQLETEALNWLIPELLPVGETIILSAAPKAGKTLLAVDAAFAVATGESDFLGEKVKQGKVLLVEADESLSSTRSKLLKRGFREGDNISILPSWDISQLDKLESMLEDFRPDLVIIDSLRRIHHGCSISENSAEFADSIYTLKELFNRYKASGILIHHSNKDKESMGVNKLRGSSAIAGAVWGTWQLDHIPVSDPDTKKLIIDPKDPRRILSVFARDTEGQTANIELDLENNSWIKQQPEEETEIKSLRDRILKVLEKNNHLPGLSGREIIQLLGEEGKGTYTILNRMVNKKLINCHPAPGDKRVNLYSLLREDVTVDFRDSPPPTPTVQTVDYYAESYIQQGLENSQQNSQHPPKNSQHPENENTPVDFLSLDSESVLEIVNTFDAQGGGVGVPCASSNTFEKEKTALKVGDQAILDCPRSAKTQQLDLINPAQPEETEIQATLPVDSEQSPNLGVRVIAKDTALGSIGGEGVVESKNHHAVGSVNIRLDNGRLVSRMPEGYEVVTA